MLYFPFGLAVEVGAGVELEFEAVAVAVGTGLSDESGASEASGELVGSAESGVAEGSAVAVASGSVSCFFLHYKIKFYYVLPHMPSQVKKNRQMLCKRNKGNLWSVKLYIFIINYVLYFIWTLYFAFKFLTLFNMTQFNTILFLDFY